MRKPFDFQISPNPIFTTQIFLAMEATLKINLIPMTFFFYKSCGNRSISKFHRNPIFTTQTFSLRHGRLRHGRPISLWIYSKSENSWPETRKVLHKLSASRSAGCVTVGRFPYEYIASRKIPGRKPEKYYTNFLRHGRPAASRSADFLMNI